MITKYKYWRNIIGILFLLTAPIFLSSTVKATIQGSTVIGNYFLYAEVTNNGTPACGVGLYKTAGCNVNIYRCKRSGGTVMTKTCKKIVKNARLGHANTLDSIWGTDYFYVYNGWCNPKTMNNSTCVKGCYSTSGKKIAKKECDKKSKGRANNDSNYFKTGSNKDCGHTQGYARYKVGKDEYFLKGFSNCSGGNKISIFKNKKHQKTITGLKPGRELEDVMVDCAGSKNYCVVRYSVNGDIGHIYGTNYKLPKTSASTQEIKKYKGSHISPANPKKIKAKNSSANTESQYDGSVDTIFFGKVEGDDKGCGVSKVFVFIIEILTYGIGITAVIGISIFGIMYLTAGGDAAKTTKAKKRILEIVVGLALYAVLWALLNFLLPGGKLNSIDQCGKADQSSSEQYIA